MDPMRLALIITLLAGQTIFEWVDAQGQSHFTNDPQSIPGIIAEQMLAGRKLVFDSTILVLTAECRVLGFR